MKRSSSEQILLSEVQLLLAEKRTYYALLRTGLAVFGLPLTILAFLIATTNLHDLFKIYWIAIISAGTLALVSMIGLYVTYRSEMKIRTINKLVKEIEAKNKRVAEIVI